jgi:hypothetical protein
MFRNAESVFEQKQHHRKLRRDGELAAALQLLGQDCKLIVSPKCKSHNSHSHLIVPSSRSLEVINLGFLKAQEYTAPSFLVDTLRCSIQGGYSHHALDKYFSS